MGMNRKYLVAAFVSLGGVAIAAVSVLMPVSVGFAGLVLASAALPAAVLLVAVAKLDRPVPLVALVAGGTLAIAMSLIGYALLAAGTYLILGSFAEWAIKASGGILDAELMETVRDPWMIVFAIDVIVLAPLVEEFAKAISGRLSRPFDRKSALLAGIAAGVGFAVIENIAYAAGGLFDGGGWETVILVRMLGSAVHPVAAGLVGLGWWELRKSPNAGRARRLIGAGVGVHALWNGAVTAVFVASVTFSDGSTLLESVLVSVAYAGALGGIIAVGGWQSLSRVANDELPAANADPDDAKAMSAWVVIASTMLIPAIVVVLALNTSG
jgi:RsiW-degrading membrane proteinase PrsW (M82 family)